MRLSIASIVESRLQEDFRKFDDDLQTSNLKKGKNKEEMTNDYVLRHPFCDQKWLRSTQAVDPLPAVKWPLLLVAVQHLVVVVLASTPRSRAAAASASAWHSLDPRGAVGRMLMIEDLAALGIDPSRRKLVEAATGAAPGSGHAAPTQVELSEVMDMERGRYHGGQVAVASPPLLPPQVYMVHQDRREHRGHSSSGLPGASRPDRGDRRELYAQTRGGSDRLVPARLCSPRWRGSGRGPASSRQGGWRPRDGEAPLPLLGQAAVEGGAGSPCGVKVAQ
uniref:Uncharacterized protein n=1 Tax=Oryza barthii TaxID=65489 RepID=A0A679B9R3_9ORYZ|nr:hypothetical protein [Oryza barthii]